MCDAQQLDRGTELERLQNTSRFDMTCMTHRYVAPHLVVLVIPNWAIVIVIVIRVLKTRVGWCQVGHIGWVGTIARPWAQQWSIFIRPSSVPIVVHTF